MEYANLPQKYDGKDNNGDPLDTATVRVDPSIFISYSGGLGVNCTPLDNVFINTLLTVTLGNGEWTEETPVTLIRTEDKSS